jgi:hypothetical protein
MTMAAAIPADGSRRIHRDEVSGGCILRSAIQLDRFLRRRQHGHGWGKSNWNAGPGISGSTSLFQTIDTFDEAGSFFAGGQGGYNYVLPNRILLGAEVDAALRVRRSHRFGRLRFGRKKSRRAATIV